MRKSNFFIAVILSSCIFLNGCDAVYRLIQREGAEEKEILGEVVPFIYNPVVEELQKLLKLHGYGAGTADGKFGAATRKMLAKFQEDHNLKVSRFVDKATWQELNAFNDSGLVSGGEVNMATVQTALKNAGFGIGKIDGKMGPKSQAALREFQRANGLKPDGKIGPKTLNLFLNYLPVE
ncbi:MAG: peptidoglycan-binding protein [Candidatus Omnitrophota bacterium]